MTVDTPRAARPPELTVVVVLTYATAIISIVLGVLLILLRYGYSAHDGGPRAVVTLAGAIIVLVGFLTVAVASGIARGDRSARLIATVLVGIGMLAAVVSLLLALAGAWPQIIELLLGAAVIIVLWAGRARRFFAMSGSSAG